MTAPEFVTRLTYGSDEIRYFHLGVEVDPHVFIAALSAHVQKQEAAHATLAARVRSMEAEARELVEVASRAIRLSLEYQGGFKVHAMEPLHQAIERTRAVLSTPREETTP